MALVARGDRGPAVDFQISDWSDVDPHFTAVCSEATLQSDRRGFFLEFAEQVTDKAGPQFLLDFGQLSKDADRLSACYSHPKVMEPVRSMLHNIQPIFRSKAAAVSRERRREAEHILRGGNARGALTLLSQAVIRASGPGTDNEVDDGLTLALALWSRSQALLVLKYFSQSIADIQLSIKSGLPQGLRHEAFYRMGLCQHGLGEVQKAAVSYQVAGRLVEKLEDSKERVSWTATVQQALGALRVPREVDAQRISEPGPLPPVSLGRHPALPAASSLLEVTESLGRGRYMIAAEVIRPGDTLVVESPEAACLLPDKFGTHCHHCFSRLVAPVPCEWCSGVAFCGTACRDTARSYHRHECRHMGLLLGSGMSVLCHVALRIVTEKGLAFFRDLRQYLLRDATDPPLTEPADAAQRRYLKVYNLQTHKDKRSPKDFLQRTLMALFLLRILRESGFFPQVSSADGDLNEDELLVGTALLRHLQVLQFNAHEVYETVILPRKEQSKFRSARVVYIGVAIYPTVALFNHDCYPAVTRHFHGKDIVITAARPLSPGDVAAENYGPIFTKRTLEQRQRSLSSRYWFRCTCVACKEDWPLMEQLRDDEFKIRCPTPGCAQSLTAPRAQDSVASADCPRCGQPVDLAGIGRRLATCSANFDAALDAMERSDPLVATPILCRYLDDMDVLVRPPMRSVHLAQEALRTCLADSGNVWSPT